MNTSYAMETIARQRMNETARDRPHRLPAAPDQGPHRVALPQGHVPLARQGLHPSPGVIQLRCPTGGA